jgi:phosphatidate cytidylyltransferase
LLLRIITGVVGIALAAVVIQTGGYVFAGAVILLSLIGWHEYARAFMHHGDPIAYFAGMIILLLLGGCAWLGTSDEFLAVATLGMLFIFMEAVLLHRRFSIASASLSVAGIFYVGFSFSHLLLLRAMEGDAMVASPAGNMTWGCALVWVALIGTWASDTFAYFTGSLLGSHKLCPSISPGKTVEGFVGGFIGTVLSVIAVGRLVFDFDIILLAVLGVCIAIAAPLGDLVESVIKRYTGIKDSGNIIPGHGGVLDRFDSVMFSVPVVYYFVQIVTALR